MVKELHAKGEMVGELDKFDFEAGDFPLHFESGGPAVCLCGTRV